MEEAVAFTRAEPEGAHIFSDPKCLGKFQRLDEKFQLNCFLQRWTCTTRWHRSWNRERRKTMPKATLERVQADFSRRSINGRQFVVLPINLWRKQRKDADAWTTYLKNGLTVTPVNGQFCIEGLSVSIEERRRLTLVHEDEEEGNRTWVTAVPGLLDPTKSDFVGQQRQFNFCI